MKTLRLIGLELLRAIKKLPILLAAALFFCGCFIAALPGSMFSRGMQLNASVALVSNQDSEINSILESLLSETGFISEVYNVEQEEGQRLLDNGLVDVLLEIPDDVVEVLVYGGETNLVISSNNPVIGAGVELLGGAAADTMSRIQSASLAHAAAISPLYEDKDELYDQLLRFDALLIRQALSRNFLLNVIRPVSGLKLQIATLLTVLISSVAVFSTVVGADRELNKKYLARLRFHNVGFSKYWASKAVSCFSAVILLCSIIFGVVKLAGVDFSLSFWKLLVSALMVTAALLCICSVFVRAGGKTDRAGLGAAWGSFIAIILMLFAGGGFYPVYLLDMSIRLINPAWLAHVMCQWAMGGDAVSLPLIIGAGSMSIVCLAFSALKWRRAQCG